MKYFLSGFFRVFVAISFVMIADAYFHGWRRDDPFTYFVAANCAVLWTVANAIEAEKDGK